MLENRSREKRALENRHSHRIVCRRVQPRLLRALRTFSGPARPPEVCVTRSTRDLACFQPRPYSCTSASSIWVPQPRGCGLGATMGQPAVGKCRPSPCPTSSVLWQSSLTRAAVLLTSGSHQCWADRGLPAATTRQCSGPARSPDLGR